MSGVRRSPLRPLGIRPSAPCSPTVVTTRRANSMCRRRGLALIELLILIAVIGTALVLIAELGWNAYMR